MPRVKAPAPKRLGAAADSAAPTPKKRVEKSRRDSRPIKSAPPEGSLILGSEPLRFIWHNTSAEKPGRLMRLIVEEDDEIQYFADDIRINPSSSLISKLWNKSRGVHFIYSSSTEDELFLDVAIQFLPWSKATDLVEALCDRDYSQFEDTPDESSGKAVWKNFFKELSEIQSARPRVVVADFQDPELVPVLRGYQADAVAWMVSREGPDTVALNMNWISEVADSVPGRYCELLYNKYSRTLCFALDRPTISSGGILADEMGLGKTVMALALILKNKRPLEVEYTEDADSKVIDVTSEGDTSTDEDEDWEPGDFPKSRSVRRTMKPRIGSVDSGFHKNAQGRYRKSSDTTDEDECCEVVFQTVRKKRRKASAVKASSEGYDSDKSLSEREKNQENCLDANEELLLVPNKARKGILAKRLNEWYESKLAEVSVRSKISKRKSVQFRCICGDSVDEVPRGAIACSECNLYQHASCVGYNRKDKYFCPSCWGNINPVKSAATLIVAPPAIFQQWGSEVERHAPSLRLLRYSGVSQSTFIQPTHIAKFDVVLTTYQILSAETNYNVEGSSRCLRQESRFLRSSCPLTSVSWWRVICDEAQLVESDGSKVRQLVQQLSAVHHWSVTGTPIQRGIADLFYLTQFMGLGPLDDKVTWLDFLLKPYLAGFKTPLLSVLSQVFWRSTKDGVSAELALPEQTFRSHLLRFSAIEESFYMQEHSNSTIHFSDGLNRMKISSTITLDSIDKGTLKRILQPLLNLRQACIHPQVVKGVHVTSATGAANLSELLTYLSRKTKQECEESLRRYNSALNGMAGLHCLREEWIEAIDLYRTVLRLAEEYRENVQVDTLQRIHALTNAADILEKNKDSVPPTLRDDTLQTEAEELEKKYLSKAKGNFESSISQARTFGAEIIKIREQFESAPDAWWVPVILELSYFEKELLDKLQEDLHSNDPADKFSMRSYLKKLNSLRAIEVTITQWWSAVEKYRKKALSALCAATDVPIKELVEAAVECHLRTTSLDINRQKCDLCKVEKIMLDLECELFATTRKKMKKKREKVMDGAETKGSWKPHYTERALLIVINFARNKHLLEEWCLADGKLHAKLIDLMKKEFKQVRSAWTELNHLVQSEDEIDMCKLRLRTASSWEIPQKASVLALTQPNKAENLHVIDAYQVDPMLMDLKTESVAYFSTFKKKYGQMLYLRNLGQTRNAVPDPCPVCQGALEQRWCVLQCGHCFCIDCIRTLCGRRVKCPVCREITESSDLSFVDTRIRADTSGIVVYGDFSTKVDAIVRTCLELLQEDSTTKILIFSSWIGVLKILEKALKLNKVSSLVLQSGQHQKTLQAFRDPSSLVSVLLLPVSWGSKGLNLIEATHVFLTEPILNPAEELQAIGRVHRIGQTKSTVVHRFLIQGTIEEKIYATVSEAKDKWEHNTVTIADLQSLFMIPHRAGE